MIQWEWGGGVRRNRRKKEPPLGVRGSAVESEYAIVIIVRYSLFLKQVLLLLSVGFYGVLR